MQWLHRMRCRRRRPPRVLFALKPFVETPNALICAGLVAVSYAAYLAFLVLFPDKRAYLFQNAEFIRARFAR